MERVIVAIEFLRVLLCWHGKTSVDVSIEDTITDFWQDYGLT